MAEVIGILAEWRLILIEHELDIICRSSVKPVAADQLSGLKTKSEECTPLDDEVRANAISLKSLVYEPSPEEAELIDIEEPKGPVVLINPEVCTMADMKHYEMTEVPILFKSFNRTVHRLEPSRRFCSSEKTKRPIQSWQLRSPISSFSFR